MAATVLPERKDVPEEFKWRMEDVYATDALWEADFERLSQMYPALEDYAGRLSESADVLLAYLQKKDEIMNLLGRLYLYAQQKSHEDLGNATYQELNDRMGALAVKVESACAFENPEILAMDAQKVRDWTAENDGLKVYGHYLDNVLRMQPHTLSRAEERLLSDMGAFAETPETIFTMLNDADLKFPTVLDEDGNETTITHGNYVTLLESKDRGVREAAFKALYDTYGQFKNTTAAVFAAYVKKEMFYAKARKYDSARAMHLDENAIDLSVYDNLIETVHQYLPAMYDYVALRKKVLGLDEIHMYDLYVPIVPEVSMKFTYDEAKAMVLDGLGVLGSEYTDLLKKGFESRWIDVYENQRKLSGAYSNSTYGVHPYVLLDFQGNLSSVFTLAHEMGHSLHSYYSDSHQAQINASYSLFLAEIASTCNEVLLTHHLLETVTDKNEKAYILNHYLDTIKGTLFRQTMFAEFEKRAFEMAESGISLTAENLSKLYHELNVLYYGTEIVSDPEIDLEWSKVPHFYMQFYVYQYATGISAASAFAKAILEEGEPAVARYKNFLSAGCSKYPLDILADAGVDMRSGKPVADALENFKHVLSQLEALLAEE